ncbi:MAG: hypothetical protein ABI411_20180, partial [Tahibacter sp.]
MIKSLVAIALLAAAAAPSVAPSLCLRDGAGQCGPVFNGISLNGVQFNGMKLNGMKLNGIQF